MQASNIRSRVFYKHRPEETDELSQATIPMAIYVSAVGSTKERSALKHILSGKYFTERDHAGAVSMLNRACKYARAHLNEVFPIMRDLTLTQITALEQATAHYRRYFISQKKSDGNLSVR
jgi:hypothetical protein